MPAFLSDPSPAFLLLLGIAALISLGVWFRWRTKKALIAAVVLLLLLGLTLLLGSMCESPREEAMRRINLMCTAATESKGDSFVEHVSKSFNSSGVKKEALRSSQAWELIKRFSATVTASGFSRDDFQQVNDTEFSIGFMAKAEARDGGLVLKYTKATFTKDPDGAWRLKDIAFFNPINTKQQEPIPGFP